MFLPPSIYELILMGIGGGDYMVDSGLQRIFLTSFLKT